MTGIEFYVVQADPPSFFLIQKRRRISEDDGMCKINLKSQF